MDRNVKLLWILHEWKVKLGSVVSLKRSIGSASAPKVFADNSNGSRKKSRNCNGQKFEGEALEMNDVIIGSILVLLFTTCWANSEDDRLLIFFLFFQENKFWYFMHIMT